jgi:uncharacterized integral membrane protein (TIGR00698 family)
LASPELRRLSCRSICGKALRLSRIRNALGGGSSYQDDRSAPECGVADLYCDIEEPTKDEPLGGLIPGLAVTALATLAAAYISDRYGAPLTLMALLVGLAMNFLNSDARLKAGLTFASGTLLRVSIVLVGAQVTVTQFANLGFPSVLAIIAIVAVTIGSGAMAARWLGLGGAFGTLAGGAVAICGASAALALSSVLGERRINQAQLALVLVGISAVSSLAMVLYPILAHYAGMGDVAAGFLLGASIHDVAQTLGAGYSFSADAGEVAAIVKMSRVALLAPVLIAVSLLLARDGGGKPKTFMPPWFVIGFFAVAAVSAFGAMPAPAAGAAKSVSAALLAGAVTAAGIRSPLQSLVHSGIRPFLVILTATLVALVAAFGAAFLLF